MTLITIVIAFALELLSSAPARARFDAWFERWRRRLESAFGDGALWNGTGGVLLTLALPLVAVGLLQGLLQGVWLGLLGLVFAILVLTYGLRYRGLDILVDRYGDAAESGDHDSAAAAARELLAIEEDRGADVRTMSEAVLIQANHRLFAVVFWFAVLGAIGAVLYRLTWQLAQLVPAQGAGPSPAFVGAARRLLGILDWIPVRLVGAGYALSGNFEDALHEWRMAPPGPDNWVEGNYDLLRRTGSAALQPERYAADEAGGAEEPTRYEPAMVRAARGLVLRTVVIWGIVIALMTLVGWSD